MNNTTNAKPALLFLLGALVVGGAVAREFVAASRVGREGGETHRVVLRGEGFGPVKLTINRGDTVQFTTTRGKIFWPASNIHPSHGLYPEFDPKEPINPGTSWSFVFEKPGEWKYHDHLAPAYRGVVVVRDRAASVPGARNCSGTGAEQSASCWEERVVQTLEGQGLDAALDLFSQLYDEQPNFRSVCHELGHRLGEAAYDLRAKGRDFAVGPKTAYCSFGFYHGFMESLVRVSGNPREARDLCTYVNNRIGAMAPDAILQCYHGVGHGVVDYEASARAKDGVREGELVRDSLSFCETAAKNELERMRCATGVYNGISFLYIGEQFELRMDLEQPLKICDAQSEATYRRECYLSMNSALLWLTKGNFRAAAAFIERIPQDGDAGPAVLNLAAATIFANPDHRKAVDECRALEERLRIPCIQGYAYGFLEQGAPGVEYKGALAICGEPFLEPAEQGGCFDYIFGYLNLWYAHEKSRQICDGLEPAWAARCHGKLRVPEWVEPVHREPS